MGGTTLTWIFLILYIGLQIKKKEMNKVDVYIGFILSGITLILTCLIPFFIGFEEFIIFLNNTIGRFTRMVVTR